MRLLPHQHVDAAVVIIGRIERRNAIFLGPVRFEVGERLVVETADQGEGMRVGLQLCQVFMVLLQGAALLPELVDPRGVLPAIEAFQVLIDLQGTQRYPAAQACIETSVHFATRLGRPARVALAVADLHLLGVHPGDRLAKPGLGQLPEQRTFTQVHAGLLAGQQQAADEGFGQHLGQVPGQALAGDIACQQPIAGSPQRLVRALWAKAFKVHLKGRALGQAQLDQRATGKGQAQPALALIGAEGAPAWR
ncbi:hypothetical protein D3C80_1110000 [compost metagenome]